MITGLKEFDSRVIVGRLFRCFLDFCQEGIQFCGSTGRRCEYCNAYLHSCFTNLQQQNCTEYCMDQWIQNQNYKNAGNCGENDIYEIMFFVLLGVCSVVALVLICKLNSTLREKIVSFVPCCKSRTPSNQAQSLSNGYLVPASTSSNGQLANSTYTANSNIYQSIHRSLRRLISPTIAQKSRIHADRQGGDGQSHRGRVARVNMEGGAESQNRQQPHQPLSPNETPNEQRLQLLTRAAKRSYPEEERPFLNGVSGELKQLKDLGDSVTNAKQLNADGADRESPLPSGGFMGLPRVSECKDTGYGTNMTS